MKAIRTIKIKVGESEHFDALSVHYIAASCWVSKQVFESKELNSNRLSRAFYAVVREKFGLPSQLTCSLFRQVTANYKTLKALGKWDLCIFKMPTIPVTYARDFLRNRKGVTILGKSVTLSHPCIPENSWKDSKIKRFGRVWYLILTYEVQIPEPKAEGCIVGVDMGIKRMLVATNSSNNKTFFFHGGVLNHRRSCIRRTRAAVQSVGTRSSRRLLKRMGGNEAAVTVNLLHTASKQLVSYAVKVGARRIVVEDLSNVRDASLEKGKDLRSKVHRWPYAKVLFFLNYKAAAFGISVEKVNPRNTSRGCSACGHVSASNRNGLRFCCKKCGHKDDSDRQASKNIRLRSVLALQVSEKTASIKAAKSSDSSEIVSELFVSHGNLDSV